MHAVFRSLFAFAMTCVVSAAVSAQGTLRFAWQGSVDGGATWAGDRVEVADPNAEIIVRARIDWQNSTGYALAFAHFDATITSVQGAGLSDEVFNIARHAPLNQTTQMLAASRFGEILKIDDSRDDGPPGAGRWFVYCTQLAEIAGRPFSRDNPINIFGFSLRLDGSLGTRVVDHVFPVLAGGATVSPTLFTTPEGGSTRPSAISLPLEIVVIPAPSAAFITVCGSFMFVGRRRL